MWARWRLVARTLFVWWCKTICFCMCVFAHSLSFFGPSHIYSPFQTKMVGASTGFLSTPTVFISFHLKYIENISLTYLKARIRKTLNRRHTQKTHTHKAPLNPKQFYQKVKKSRYCYCETWWWNCNVSWEKNAAFIFNLVVHEAEKDAVPIVRPQNAWVTFKLKCFWCLVLTGAIIISLIRNARSVISMCALCTPNG